MTGNNTVDVGRGMRRDDKIGYEQDGMSITVPPINPDVAEKNMHQLGEHKTIRVVDGRGDPNKTVHEFTIDTRNRERGPSVQRTTVDTKPSNNNNNSTEENSMNAGIKIVKVTKAAPVAQAEVPPENRFSRLVFTFKEEADEYSFELDKNTSLYIHPYGQDADRNPTVCVARPATENGILGLSGGFYTIEVHDLNDTVTRKLNVLFSLGFSDGRTDYWVGQLDA